jgi:putative transposase
MDGSRVVRELHKQGVQVGHEGVRNSMKRQDLRPLYKCPHGVTTDSAATNQFRPLC